MRETEDRESLVEYVVKAAVAGAVAAVIAMLLWNWLVTDIFGLCEITFLQAWGLWILSNILFKSRCK